MSVSGFILESVCSNKIWITHTSIGEEKNSPGGDLKSPFVRLLLPRLDSIVSSLRN